MKNKTIQWVYVAVLTGCLVLLGGFSASSWAAEDGLIDAAGAGDLARVKSLLAAGADVNARDKDGRTALMMAAYGGNVEVVQALLAAKADVYAKDKDGVTALMKASDVGIKELGALLAQGLLKDLQEDEAARNLKKREQDDIKKGHIEMVRALLGAGANVNAKTTDGQTALLSASRWGYAEVVQALLAAGADVNVKLKDGTTPLNAASRGGYADVVKLLKKAGARE